MKKTKSFNKRLSVLLIVAIVVSAVLVPIYSQAGSETPYDKVTMNNPHPKINLNLQYVHNNAAAGLGIPYLTYTAGDDVQETFCMQILHPDPVGEAIFTEDVISKFNPDVLRSVKAIAGADLNSDEINNIFPGGTFERGSITDAHKEFYLKQIAILYTVNKNKPQISQNESKGAWKGIFATIDDPAAELSKVFDVDGNQYKTLLAQWKYIQKLCNDAWNGNISTPAANSFMMSPSNIDFTFDSDSDSYISSLIEFDANNKIIDNSLDYNVTITDKSDNDITDDIAYTVLNENDGIKIKIPKMSLKPGEKINVTVNGTVNMETIQFGYFYCTKNPNSGALRSQNSISPIKMVESLEGSTSGELTRDNVTGDINILKFDSDDESKVLSGAEFTLYDATGTAIKSGVTDDNGNLSFENLSVYGDEYGTTGAEYTLTETKAPVGYEKFDLYTTTFALTEENKTLTFDVPNDTIKTGELEIVKVDADNKEKTLEGAEFTLYDNDDNTVVAEGITDKNGYLKFDGLDVYGNDGTGKAYKLVETKAPVGYSNTDLFIETFTMTTDTLSLKYEVENWFITSVIENVKGDQAIPPTVQNGSVLGEEASDDDDGTVLGEEAKTADVMNVIQLLITMLVVAVISLVLVVRSKRRNE